MNKTVFKFYVGGVSIVIYGILILLGFDLPKRNGKMPEHPLDYAQEMIIIGITVLLLTYIFNKYHNSKK